MTEKTFMAGFGGQGIISMGELWVYFAMKEGLEVTFFPFYGAEKRGGIARASVVVSSKEIASPLVTCPDSAIAMKVLSGVHPYGSFTGDILIEGKPQAFKRIADSEKAGIAVIYQELALVPEMTVYENIFLGNEVVKNGLVDENESIKRAREMLKRVRLDLNPTMRVKDLGVGKRQLIEIAKALSRNVTILVLDEPTAALNEDDCDNLLEIIRGLKAQGVTCVMISHKLKEVIKIADTVTVLRDGQTVCTLDAHKGEVSESVLIKHMFTLRESVLQGEPPRGLYGV